ncbi:potassium channel subfamily U member 1-like [Suncus etruscus]|uniref:potassium channel subfamily U member 1-like n=1 Tax=Suncus etruscus TaxID=109475 RepID=UPI002110C8CF|nr:potassium channel subfamily U member 1-like [Suncus etruscus]
MTFFWENCPDSCNDIRIVLCPGRHRTPNCPWPPTLIVKASPGLIQMILVFLLSIGSLIIYFINSTDPVASCTAYDDITISFDMIINGFFAIYFGLRFLAADDKIKFWLQINTIVDIFTIPTPFISCYLKRNWLGLRFLRALRLLELPQILQILGSIKTRNSMKFSKLLTITLSCCLTAAGFIHLVENFGDPWLKVRNSQTISYFECIYLIIATITTVGYGDFVANTLLGRTFIILFILGSLVTFANYIPEMVEILAQKRKYNRSYKACKGKKFIVVCGNITVESVGAFLGNFLRLKSGKLNTEVVFLGEVVPSLELEALFRCYLAYTTFIYGSALKMKDLKRVSMEAAEACLIIANPSSGDSHEEDTTNIMRVLSIKNYFPKTRIIIQILRPHNKSFLSKIPSWDWNSGDNIICFAELKLGFIAQGCLVPGLCTFLTSLFIKQSTKVCLKNPWQHDFYKSLSNTILTQRLSDDFAGMSFYEVCRLCFVKMNIMLIAIEYKSMFYGPRRLLLNPPAQIKLRKNTLGFFIAESAREVKRAYLYCVYCHGNVSDPDLIEKCNCKARSRRIITVSSSKQLKCTLKKINFRVRGQTSPISLSASTTSISEQTARTLQNFQTQEKSMLDSSGMFHWCKATPLENVILRKTDKLKHGFQNHVVVCIFGDAQSRLMGLQNFVMPLRASNYTEQELKDIVFIGSLDYLKKEWQFLEHFPKLFILPGSALYTKDLFAVNIDKCSMCVILPSTSESSRSATLVDSENILATLNIKSFKFFPTSPTTMERFSPQLGRKGKFRRVPALTELKNPSNIHFIEQLSGMEGLFPGTNLHLSTAFATGTVFSGNFLDSLLASAFYNYHVLEFLEMLVRGGISSHMQSHFDNNKQKSQDLMHNSTLVTGRTRCKLGLLPLEENVLSRIEPKTSFEQLFCGSLDKFGIICLGLYRLMDEEDPKDEPKRFVITRPPKDFKLLMSDLVFCAIPYGLKWPEGQSDPVVWLARWCHLIQGGPILRPGLPVLLMPLPDPSSLPRTHFASGRFCRDAVATGEQGQCPGLDKEESPHDFASPESESEDGIHRDSKKVLALKEKVLSGQTKPGLLFVLPPFTESPKKI